MKVLFICNQNENRSKTAEVIFRDKCNSRSAGLFNLSPITAEEIGWADLVVVMEESQRKEIASRFPSLYLQKRIVSLDIPDVYRFNDPTLISMLDARMEQFF
jgi:predicted protein tyrosine phosphatase